MLHTEPSFSVYADEKGDLKIHQGNSDFSFANEDDAKFTGFQNLGINDQDPLLLKKQAHLLQSKGDLNGAEEYYLRAIREDPNDGETLMQYAKLVWELHRDKDRALDYFNTAIHAAPEDSDVLGAYASFLWEIGEENDEGSQEQVTEDGEVISKHAQSVWEVDRDQDKATGYFERAIEVDPTNSNVLAAYAKFLWEVEDQENPHEALNGSVATTQV